MLTDRLEKMNEYHSNRIDNEIKKALEVKLAHFHLIHNDADIKLIEDKGLNGNITHTFVLTNENQKYNLISLLHGGKMSGFSYKFRFYDKDRKDVYIEHYMDTIKFIMDELYLDL